MTTSEVQWTEVGPLLVPLCGAQTDPSHVSRDIQSPPLLPQSSRSILFQRSTRVRPSSPAVKALTRWNNGRYQEDASSIQALQLSPQELQSSLAQLKKPAGWDPSAAGSEFLARQVAYFGIFDGYVVLSCCLSVLSQQSRS